MKSMKFMKFMKRGVSGGRASSSRQGTLDRVRPTARTGATTYKSGQLSAIGFRILSV
jgi:hypothetical protein